MEKDLAHLPIPTAQTKAEMNNDEQIRQRNKDLHHNAALHWNSLANEQELELTKQILSLAAILLTISASLVAVDQGLITQEIRILLLLVWVFLIVSIFFGVVQIITNIKYFVFLMKDENKRAHIWSKLGEATTELDKEERSLGRTKESSGNIWLILQGVFMGLSILFIISIGVTLLFSP